MGACSFFSAGQRALYWCWSYRLWCLFRKCTIQYEVEKQEGGRNDWKDAIGMGKWEICVKVFVFLRNLMNTWWTQLFKTVLNSTRAEMANSRLQDQPFSRRYVAFEHGSWARFSGSRGNFLNIFWIMSPAVNTLAQKCRIWRGSW